MSQDCDTASTPMSPCEMLNRAVLAVQEAVTGDAVKSLNLRDRGTSFVDSSLESRKKYLVSLLATNSQLFCNCKNYDLAIAVAGIPTGRDPGVLRKFSRNEPCGGC